MSALHIFAYCLLTCGALVSAANIYLSFVRPLIWGRRKDYRFISGAPLLGSLLILSSLVAFSFPPLLRWFALALALLDPLGIVFFVVAMLGMKTGGNHSSER